MTEEEIHRIVVQVLEAEKASADNFDRATLKTISALLTSFGVTEEERKEFAEDFRYLRRWRLGAEKVTGTTLKVIVTIIAGGFVSAFGLGIKAILGK